MFSNSTTRVYEVFTFANLQESCEEVGKNCVAFVSEHQDAIVQAVNAINGTMALVLPSATISEDETSPIASVNITCPLQDPFNVTVYPCSANFSASKALLDAIDYGFKHYDGRRDDQCSVGWFLIGGVAAAGLIMGVTAVTAMCYSRWPGGHGIFSRAPRDTYSEGSPLVVETSYRPSSV